MKTPKQKKKLDTPKKPFRIAGVGTSAGGLEALTELLKALPDECTMSFIIVQHLNPDLKSSLTQILSRISPFPVKEITTGLRVQSKRIYILPPNHNVTINQGVLKLTKWAKLRKETHYHTIDTFMESLAQDQKDNAVGIILSGAGSDGSRGLEAIKTEGGITFVQDDTAAYDQMPKSAIQSACVDFILSPLEIANELGNISKISFPIILKHSDGHEASSSALSDDNEISKILDLLHNYSGVDFSQYKPTTIERRIARRMVLNKKDSIKDYITFLRGNTSELNALYSDVLINVTSFFRNPESFEALKMKVFPKLISQAGADPVRIWVVGCSSGQEAYSIGMAFLECLEDKKINVKLQIFATDLNEMVLNKARSGFYSQAFVEDVSPERLKKFFVSEEGGYRIIKQLRDMCVFAKQDLTGDPPFSRLDLITCRNVLIYLDGELQKKIIPMFHYALKPQGFLFLGASESTSSFMNIFDPFDKKHKIFSKKQVPSPTSGMHFLKKYSGFKNLTAEKQNVGLVLEGNAQREADRIVLKRYAPPAVLIDNNGQILQFRGDTSAYLQPPVGNANLNLLKMAKENLVRPLRVLLTRVQKERKVVRKDNVQLSLNSKTKLITIEIIPLKHLKELSYLVIFEKKAAWTAMSKAQALKAASSASQKDIVERVAELEQELIEARDFAQAQQEEHESIQEELKASNEEIQSSNEELQSINEELETSKEELESTNEELSTVNDELAARNTELNRLNSDLVNLQNSMITGIVLLGRDLTIRSFSPAAEKIFNIFSSDIGRPLNRIRHHLNCPNLEQMIMETIDTTSVHEREVQDKEGRWYFLRVRPYTTTDNKNDGAVIVLVDIDDHKRSKETIFQLEAARESEKRFRQLADSAPVFIWMSDATKALTWFNQSWLDFVGRPLDKEVGKGWTENIHPEDLRRCMNIYIEAFEARQPFKREYRIRKHDGEYRWFLDNAIPIVEGGEFAGYIGSCVDITDRKRDEETRTRLSAIVEYSDDAIISKDLKGIITSWNKGAERIFGYSSEEIIGKPLSILIPKERQQEEPLILERLRKGERVDHYQTVRKHKTGRLINVSLTVSPIKDSEGTITGASKIARDITEQIQNEKHLAQLASIVESSDDAIISKDLNGIIKSWNKGAERIFGYTAEEIIGKPVLTLIPEDRPNEEPLILERIRKGERIQHYETIRRRKDGSFINVSLTVSPIKDSTGVIIGASKIARDITEQVKAETILIENEARLRKLTTALANSNSELEQFAYVASHDLKEPLHVVSSFTHLLERRTEPKLENDEKEYIKYIKQGISQAQSLVKDLLEYSRLGREKEKQDIDLSLVLNEVLLNLKVTIENVHAIIKSDPLPKVQANHLGMVRVFQNLISNSLKYRSQKTPEISISVESTEEEYVFSVQDNGIGIDPQYFSKIFDMFQRLHSKSEYSGSGIGLAICKRVIENHGGRIWVISSAGKGATFFFTLPKAYQEQF